MGYTPFSKINIRIYNNKRNPVATITIPFNLIKYLKWKDKDVIFFNKYKSKITSSIDMINLNRSSKEYFKPMLLELPLMIEKMKQNRLKIFNSFPKSKTKKIIENNYSRKHYEKKDKEKIKRLEKKKIKLEDEEKKNELELLKKRKLKLSTEILNITNKFPYLKLEIKEIDERIKQISSS